jgi:hypothetical protein
MILLHVTSEEARKCRGPSFCHLLAAWYISHIKHYFCSVPACAPVGLPRALLFSYALQPHCGRFSPLPYYFD